MSWASVPPRLRARLRAAVLERDGHRCQLRIPGVCITVADCADHIRPREVAGDGLENLQAACTPCNQAKGDPRGHDPDPLPSGW